MYDFPPTPAATNGALSVEVLHDPAAWDGLAAQWQHLVSVSPTAAPPLDWHWLRTWWDIYGNRCAHADTGLRVLLVRRGTQLIGALPLYQPAEDGFGPRRWRFLSTGEAEFEETCADYLDLLHVPGEEQNCLDALRRALQHSAGAWDALELGPLSSGSPLLAWHRSPPADWRVQCQAADVSPVAHLDGGFEAYLQRLSANTRQQARRLLREAQRAGAHFELAADAGSAAEFFAQLVRLHQERWTAAGQPGCFAAPRFTAFHAALIQHGTAPGRVVLARLRCGAEPVAVLYGFRLRSRFDFYQCGACHDRVGPLRSPGITAHLLLMQRLAEEGIRRYDFLRGAAPYKEKLATETIPLVRLEVQRRSVRAAVAHAVEAVLSIVRKGQQHWHALSHDRSPLAAVSPEARGCLQGFPSHVLEEKIGRRTPG